MTVHALPGGLTRVSRERHPRLAGGVSAHTACHSPGADATGRCGLSAVSAGWLPVPAGPAGPAPAPALGHGGATAGLCIAVCPAHPVGSCRRTGLGPGAHLPAECRGAAVVAAGARAGPVPLAVARCGSGRGGRPADGLLPVSVAGHSAALWPSGCRAARYRRHQVLRPVGPAGRFCPAADAARTAAPAASSGRGGGCCRSGGHDPLAGAGRPAGGGICGDGLCAPRLAETPDHACRRAPETCW